MGPIWGRQDPGGPHVGPMHFAIWDMHLMFWSNITKVLTFREHTGHYTVYPKKYAHVFCFAVLCCGYTLTDFPISIRLTSLALWQSNDCPSASKQPWWIWINTLCEFIMNDCITTTKQSTTKPCAYFLGYTIQWQPIPVIMKWYSFYSTKLWAVRLLAFFKHDKVNESGRARREPCRIP